MKISYPQLYEEYYIRHDRNPKHDFGHFLRTLATIHHHRIHIRPKIKWWYEIRKMQLNK